MDTTAIMNQVEEIQDYPHIEGKVSKILRDKDGNIVARHDQHNLVVKVGRAVIAKLLTGTSTAKITTCAVGEGGVDPKDPFSPIEPVSDNTKLVTEKFRKNFDSVALSGTAPQTTVTFTTLFRSDEANCLASEAAMFFNDGTMFARHTFPSMYLKSDRGYSLEIAWTFDV